MHILVTGGSGFIGHVLCQRLRTMGEHVTVLTRNPDKARHKLPDDVNCIADLNDLASLPPVDAIVNYSGEPLADRRWSVARKQDFYDSRVGVTEQLYDYFASLNVPPRVLISGSAVGYYGPHGGDLLDESAPVVASFSHSLCAQWESAAECFEHLGTRVCRIRTGVVLGQGGGALSAMLPAFKLGLGGPMGSGQQWMSWVHRDDLVALIIHCLLHEEMSGPVNGTAPSPVTNREFARILGQVLHRPTWFTMPAFVLKLLFGQMADELLLSGQRAFPQAALDGGFHFRFAELRPALEDILGE